MIRRMLFVKIVIFILLFLLMSPWVAASDRGNKLIFAFQNGPNVLDPHRAREEMAKKIMSFMYDTLLMVHPETREIVPGLAKSWEISEDGLVATFHLREGVKFHDGKPLTAEDFKYTYERAKDPATKATIHVGILTHDLASIEVLDKLTFRLNFTKPCINLLTTLTRPETAPINRNSVEAQGENFGTNPVGGGTGPFKFKSWQSGQAINFVRNEDYNWGPEFYKNQGPPHIKEIEILIIPDVEVQTIALRKGEIDLADFVPPKDLESLVTLPHLEVDLDGIPSPGAVMGFFNISRPPFDDVVVRKAANYAIDEQVFIDVVKLGYAIPVYAPIPPFYFGYNKKLDDYYEYNPDKAKEMLEEAGWKLGPDGIRQKDGVKLEGKFLVRQRGDYIAFAQINQEMFKKVGIGLNIHVLEWGALVEGSFAGEHNYTLNGYSRIDSEQVMRRYFHSSNLGGWNLNQVADPHLDKLMDTALTTVNTEKRRELMERIDDIIMIEKCLVIPLHTKVEVFPINKRVQGMKWNPDLTIYPNDARIVE